MILKLYRGEKHLGKMGSNGGGGWVGGILSMISVSGFDGRQQKYTHSITNLGNKPINTTLTRTQMNIH